MTNTEIAIAIGFQKKGRGGAWIAPSGKSYGFSEPDFPNDTAAFEIDDWLAKRGHATKLIRYFGKRTNPERGEWDYFIYTNMMLEGMSVSADGPTRSAAIVAAFEEYWKGQTKP